MLKLFLRFKSHHFPEINVFVGWLSMAWMCVFKFLAFLLSREISLSTQFTPGSLTVRKERERERERERHLGLQPLTHHSEPSVLLLLMSPT
jgi:hypothetical protein